MENDPWGSWKVIEKSWKIFREKVLEPWSVITFRSTIPSLKSGKIRRFLMQQCDRTRMMGEASDQWSFHHAFLRIRDKLFFSDSLYTDSCRSSQVCDGRLPSDGTQIGGYGSRLSVRACVLCGPWCMYTVTESFCRPTVAIDCGRPTDRRTQSGIQSEIGRRLTMST